MKKLKLIWQRLRFGISLEKKETTILLRAIETHLDAIREAGIKDFTTVFEIEKWHANPPALFKEAKALYDKIYKHHTTVI